MVNVTVVFTNGNVVNLAAEEFDADLSSGGGGVVNKYPYKDAGGNDSAIHLRPDDVAGLFITPGGPLPSGDQAIAYSVAGKK